MNFGFMRDVPLTEAKDIFLFDCKVVGLDPHTRFAYREVLISFVGFTGDILVGALTPDHVREYIAELSDRVRTKRGHLYVMRKHYAVVSMWIRWLYAQKKIADRNDLSQAPRLAALFLWRRMGSL